MRRVLGGMAILAVCGVAVAAPDDIHLSAGLQQRLGVSSRSLNAARYTEKVDAFAKILDPGPLAQLESDLDSAEAAAAASAAEAKRLKALGGPLQGAATKDVEAAISQATQDKVRLALLRRRVGLEWGPGIARMNGSQRANLLNGLASGKLALVHIDTPSNEGQEGARSADVDIGSASVRAVILGPARAAEPRLQSSGLIGLVSGPLAIKLSNGLTQSAHITQAGALNGVLLPKSAIVRFAGADWSYVQTGPETFVRRLVKDPKGEDEGTFVEHGFQPGERIVVTGVAALLTADTAAAPAAPRQR